MRAINRLKEILTPTEQPRPEAFPRLYLIPETYIVDAPQVSANASLYAPPVLGPARQQSQAPLAYRPATAREGLITRFKRSIREPIELAIAEAWSATKAFGRRVVRWLAWRVFMPLSVMASIWIPSVNPAELPL